MSDELMGAGAAELRAKLANLSNNLTPIVESFSLETTLSPRLLTTLKEHCEAQGIRDPESAMAKLFGGPFDVDYNGFMADILAYASTWAYADPATFAFMMAHRGMIRWRYYYMRLGNDPLYVVSSAYLMQSYTGEVAILVFRGTEPMRVLNWLTDLTVSPDRFLEGTVHGGILRNLKAIWPLVSMGLQTVDHRKSLMVLPLPDKGQTDTTASKDDQWTHDSKEPAPDHKDYVKIYNERVYDDPRKRVRPLKGLFITGHSLGGAMAALAAANIWKNPEWREVRENLLGCYTYGAPMVASPPLADMLHREIGSLVFRHVYAYDVVPQLPPASTGRFKHFGEEYRCHNKSDGWMLRTDPIKQWASVITLPLAGLSMLIEQFPLIRGIADRMPISLDHHSPRNYMRISELSRTATF